jgi:hypothetical protein
MLSTRVGTPRKAGWLLALGASVHLVAGHAADMLDTQAVLTEPSAKVEAALPTAHPSAYYAYAGRALSEGRQDDAIFWLYVGRIRYRFLLQSEPALPPDGGPALYASLEATLGSSIDQTASADPHKLAARIERARQWDAAHENTYTSRTKYETQWSKVRKELEQRRDSLLKQGLAGLRGG